MNNSAVEILNHKRQLLIEEQKTSFDKIQHEIDMLEVAILTLGGDIFKNTSIEERFDDSNPDYIKASLEEI